MTRKELLLTKAMEECCEVAQRISKELHFGSEEVQPGQNSNNRERVIYEYADLIAVMEILGIISVDRKMIDEKKNKVYKYLIYSKSCGTLTD